MERRDDLTTSEAAEILGVSSQTMVSYANDGLVPCRRLPSGHRRFRREDVVAALLKSEPRSEPEHAA